MTNGVVVDYQARTGTFITDTKRAAAEHKKAMKEMGDSAKEFAAIIGIAYGVEQIAEFAKEIANFGHEMEEMGQKVGMSAGDLSALKVVADQAGISMDQLGSGVDKFSKNAAQAAGGAKLQAAQFKAFGIEIKDANGNLKPTSVLLDETAKKFASFRDSNVKTSDAMALFGKAGAELIPFLNRLGGEGFAGALAQAKKFGVYLDEDAVRASEDYRQSLIQLHEIVDGLGILLVSVITPAITATVNAFTAYSTETSTATGRTKAMTEALLDITQGFITVSTWVQKATVLVAGFVDILGKMGELIASTPFGRITDDMRNLQSAFTTPWAKVSAAQDLKDALHGQLAYIKDFKAAVEGVGKDMHSSFQAIDADAAAKIKALWTPPKHAASDSEKAGASAPILPAELQHVNTHALDAAKAAAQSFKDKLQELTDSLSGPAGQAQAKYDKELANFAALAVKAKGNTTDMAAATAALNKQFQQLQDELRANALGPVAQEAYQYQKALQDLSDEQQHGILNAQQYAAALDILAIAHRKNAIAAQRELDPLGALIDDMKFETDELGRTNAQRTTDNFLRAQGIPLYSKQADGIRSVIEAQVALDEQTKKSIALQDSFRGDLNNFFTDILDGSKSAKDAFKELAASILADMARVIAQNWTEKLFGQTGQNGGGMFGGLLSSFTGKFTGGNDGAVIAQTTATTANTAALISATAAYSAAALGSAFGGSGGDMSLLTSVFSGGSGSSSDASAGIIGAIGAMIPGFASGTDFAPGGLAIVGERGPELLNLPRGSQVVPNHRMAQVGHSTTITQNINVAPTTTRRTAEQVANASAKRLRVASARNA